MQVVADFEDEPGVLGKRRRDELGDLGQFFIAVALGQRLALGCFCESSAATSTPCLRSDFDEHSRGRRRRGRALHRCARRAILLAGILPVTRMWPSSGGRIVTFQRLIFLDGLHVELDFEQRRVRTPSGFGRLAGLRRLEREVEDVVVDHDRRDRLRAAAGAFGVLETADRR